MYFYLYAFELQANSEDVRPFLRCLKLPTLREEQPDSLDVPINVEEVVAIINSLPFGKSPGLYGSTAKFFKCYASKLAPVLLDMYTEAFQIGSLTQTLVEGVITVVW